MFERHKGRKTGGKRQYTVSFLMRVEWGRRGTERWEWSRGVTICRIFDGSTRWNSIPVHSAPMSLVFLLRCLIRVEPPTSSSLVEPSGNNPVLQCVLFTGVPFEIHSFQLRCYWCIKSPAIVVYDIYFIKEDGVFLRRVVSDK